jgi:hypothetical protein
VHIDSEELSGYLDYIEGRQKGVTLDQARRWMEMQGHLKTCQACQKKLAAVVQVQRLEDQIIERIAPKSKWDERVMRMKDSASVFEIRMRDMFESAEIRMREMGTGNQWQASAVRGETSQWEGSFQDQAFVLGAAAGGIYLEGESPVRLAVFKRQEDGTVGDLIYEGNAQGLEDLDLQAGDYLILVEEDKQLEKPLEK